MPPTRQHTGRDALTQALHRTHERTEKRAGAVAQLALIASVDPWTLELTESRRTLQDDEITLSQGVKAYHTANTVDVGDTALVSEKHIGGEIYWMVLDVFSDKDPGGGGHIIQDEGVDLPREPTVDFVGAGVTVTDDPADGRTVVTIGGGTGDLSHVHNQVVPLAVWTITHGLGKFPSVTVFDSAGEEWEVDFTYIDSNTISITFPAAMGGVAYLN